MKKAAIIKTTLDSKHNEISSLFKQNEEVIIPKYLKIIEKLELLLQNSTNHSKNQPIIENIKKYKNLIHSLKKQKNEYYLDNSKFIFDYFENKKNISNSDLITTGSNKNDIIHKFFSTSNNEDISINNNNNNNNNTKNSIDKYFNNIDYLYLNYDNFIYPSDICSVCKKGEMVYVESDGISVCNNCSNIIKNLIEIDKPSYKEPPKEVSFYAYKRINHLKEILAQFQAKESTNIPDEVFENIKYKIKKERISINQLTNTKTKEILKNLGYNKYYEHIPFIKDKLGIKPPIMSSELEETLCNLFIELQKPYSKYCPKERVNFLNYYYTLYKLCELLNETHFLPYFPMLKDREKRVEQDQIWKKICLDLGWNFIPTP
jgi:hypothetical protein